ncbi:hypothetical protein BDV97DRAFT_399125 [Delphinella strobiligena]|nr:hypothetical protein BDV97DRAFT_399125 [Delphinella strobiligena]
MLGEYANTHAAARKSLQNIVERLVPPGPTDRTISGSDFPEFQDRCSGCSLPRVPEAGRLNDWFRRPDAYNGFSNLGWFGVYDCKFCFSRFASKEAWLAHQARFHKDAVHELTLPNQFECPDCHDFETDARRLELHWRGHHGIFFVVGENVSFCDVCRTEHHDAHGLATHRSRPAHKAAVAARLQQNV